MRILRTALALWSRSGSMPCRPERLAVGLLAVSFVVCVHACGGGSGPTSTASPDPRPLPNPSPTPQPGETAVPISCAGFVNQPSYVGTRDPDTEVILEFSDGYRWLISDAVEGWEDHTCADTGLAAQTARGFRARYHHILSTRLVKSVRR